MPLRVLTDEHLSPTIGPELTALGYRIEVAGRRILYSGDSAWTPEFVAQSQGVDLFLCECSTYETRLPIHISYPEIAAHAAELGEVHL